MERQLQNASDGRQLRQAEADKDQAEGRHKSVKHVSFIACQAAQNVPKTVQNC